MLYTDFSYCCKHSIEGNHDKNQVKASLSDFAHILSIELSHVATPRQRKVRGFWALHCPTEVMG